MDNIKDFHERAMKNTYISEEEILLISTVDEIYKTQGINGLVKILDRFIYYSGISKSIDIVKEVKNESCKN